MTDYPSDFARRLMEPKNRGEQVDTTTEFVIDNPDYYESLNGRAARVDAAGRIAFKTGLRGYHAQVLRAAYYEYDLVGYIRSEDPPFDLSGFDP